MLKSPCRLIPLLRRTAVGSPFQGLPRCHHQEREGSGAESEEGVPALRTLPGIGVCASVRERERVHCAASTENGLHVVALTPRSGMRDDRFVARSVVLRCCDLGRCTRELCGAVSLSPHIVRSGCFLAADAAVSPVLV